ncbi:MAG: hypothetical protein Q9183_003595 [Haloplaca sp. 2 TL-2023]
MSSPLSSKRRAPAPFLSFTSLNPFQAPGSNVSSPGSLYLSPPISSPSLMSPPPRQEAEDYLSLDTSHSGKKKHHSRISGSPLAVGGQKNPQVPTTKAPQTVPVSQRRIGIAARPPTTLPDENTESPAVASLRRMSEATKEKSANRKPSVPEERAQPLTQVLGSTFSTNSTDTPNRKASVEGDSIPTVLGLRRRSTALRDGTGQPSSKDAAKPTVDGLALPSTIILRKATGLFRSAADPMETTPATQSTIPDFAGETDPPSLSRTCTLVGFGSQPLDPVNQTPPLQQDHPFRRPSVVSSKAFELSSSRLGPREYAIPESPQQNLSETVVTTTNIFPSPAILASPVKSAPGTNEPERRISVVQIQSRKSVHQVIWREDETSSSSGTSSDHVSPTSSLSIKKAEPTNKIPGDSSAVNEAGPAEDLVLPPAEEQSLPPDELPQDDSASVTHIAVKFPENHMVRWTWGGTDDSGDKSSEIDAVKARGASGSSQASYLDPTSGAVPSPPQLFVPEGEDSAAMAPGSGFARRASHAIDASLSANTGAGREYGSRRSISVHPMLLTSFGDVPGNDAQRGEHTSRRLSRVY